MSQKEFRTRYCSEHEGDSPQFTTGKSRHSEELSASMPENAIAIVGFAFRFPNDISDETDFWSALTAEDDLVTQIPSNRWATTELQHPKRNEPGRSITFSAGTLSKIDEFDAAFFGISAREAAWLDPQQRLLLELSWEAMENAGIVPSSLAGSDCAVYVGISGLDYGTRALDDLAGVSAHLMTGNTLSIAANRLSYIFDLHGPSVSVDTACSSSLVALHQACNCLHTGDASTALVGGVNLLLHPYPFVGFTKSSMLSANGRCKPFDASGDGYVRSEGGAVLLLKRLTKALEDNDDIQAIILGTGINSDGARKTGITIPSKEGQAELMRKVLVKAGLSGQHIDYVEAHGTGTIVGDPIEAGSIGKIYGKARSKGNPLPIGSIKSNLGHMEAASGMAGLVKALMVLKHRAIPPNIHLKELNPHIDFEDLNLEVVRQYTQLIKPEEHPAVVAINSFGFGGTNAHVLLQEFQIDHPSETCVSTPSFPPLFLSAQTSGALRELAGRYAELIDTRDAVDFYDIAYSAAHYREVLEKRLILSADNKEQAITVLSEFAQGNTANQIIEEDALIENGEVAFVYSGNGAQWVGMGQRLLAESSRFIELLTMLDDAMLPSTGFSILAALKADDTESQLDDTTIAQPLLFALQVAITCWLKEQGIQPHAVTGHSVGEVAAAWASGALTLPQAISVICARSHAQGKTRGSGRMAAVALSKSSITALISELDLADCVEVSGVNSPNNVTLSGELAALEQIQAVLKPKGVFFVLLDLDYAFHSKNMDCIKETLLESLKTLSSGVSKEAQFVSTVTGKVLDGEALNADYWWQNIRQPVHFAEAIQSLIRMGCRVFVEISPHAILQRYMSECLTAEKVTGRTLFVFRKQDEGLEQIQRLAFRLHMLAEYPNWNSFFPTPGRRIRLPNYPWQKERHWHPVTNESKAVLTSVRVHPLLGWRLADVDIGWENTIDTLTHPWLIDHQVANSVVLPGAAYAELALAAANEWHPGESPAFEELSIISPIVFDEQHARTLRFTIDPRDGTFQIKSRQRLSDDEWALHAIGRIISATDHIESHIPPVKQVEYAIDHKTHYALCASLGLDYGPLFQGLKQASVCDHSLQAALSTIDQNDTDSGYILHPASLDVCFQSLVDFYQQDIDAGRGVALLPIKFGRIVIHHRALPTSFRAHLRKQSGRSVLVDFELFDDKDMLMASVSACRFRAAAFQHRRQQNVHGWEISASLKPHPADTLLTEMPSARVLSDHLRHWFISQETELKRAHWFQETQPLFEALSLSFMFEAMSTLLKDHSDKIQDMLNDPSAAGLLRFIKHCLIQEGLLAKQNEHWVLIGTMPSSEEIWQTILHDHPASLTELVLIGRTGCHLAELLIGKTDSKIFAEELYQSPTVESLYDDPAYQGGLFALRQSLFEIAQNWPEHKQLRVLEFSLNNSQLAIDIHQKLPEDRLHYVLAISDEKIQHRSQTEYRDFPNIAVVHADFSTRQLGDDTILPDQFDVVILHHVLHQAPSPKSALVWIKELMSPDALLLLAERQSDWSSSLIGGIDPEWWYQSEEAEPVTCLLPIDAWQTVLDETGFTDIESFIEPEADDNAQGVYLILAKHSEQDRVRLPETQSARWLILTDPTTSNVANSLIQLLEAQGQAITVNVELSTLDRTQFDHIVFMRDWMSCPDHGFDRLHELLHLVQRSTTDQQASLRLWIITHGGNLSTTPIGSVSSNPIQTALWGFGRVVMNEHPELSCTLIDVAYSLTGPRLSDRLGNELLRPDGSNEIILTEDARYHLLMQEIPLQKKEIASDRYRLDFHVPGQLRNLIWIAQDQAVLEPHEIEICPKAVGLNFRDVMYLMGLLPDESVETGFAGASLGLEFSGIVNRVGDAVHGYLPGDAVMGFGSACFSSHLVTRDDAIARMPEGWSFEAAATVPTVFFTVYYALKQLANLQPGERILIHGGAGGVGIAAIQLAKHLGAEIYVTAGSEEKRDFVHLLGTDHVFDSRSLAFADDILAVTNGDGVDVVLNSLAGEAIRSNLRILKPFGRFLELGKRDFVENTPIGLRYFKDNISYFGIDADQLLTGNPALAARMFSEVMALLRDGTLSPLPWRLFSADRVIDAFRTMQQAKHIGKIVVNFSPTFLPAVECKATIALPLSLEKESTWLVTGGLSGFGLESARWLASRGVGNLVLLNRRGMDTPNAQEILDSFGATGVSAHAVACDITNRDALNAVITDIEQTLPPLKGIIHAAAVFEDAPIYNLDTESMNAVLNTKLLGAWNLHELTLQTSIDYFILYSSITTLIGNPGQANYVAANSGLEGLASLRRRMGLPALAVAFGPIGDAGYLVRNSTIKETLAHRLGKAPLSAREALDQLDYLLQNSKSDGSCYAVANFEWSTLSQLLPSSFSDRFAVLNRNLKEGSGDETMVDFQTLIIGKTESEIVNIVQTLITQEVAQILSVDIDRIAPTRSLHDLGMDSLMAVELVLGLEQRFGIRLPTMMLNDSPTVERVTSYMVQKVLGTDDDESSGNLLDDAVETLIKQHGEDISKEEIRNLAKDANQLSKQGIRLIS